MFSNIFDSHTHSDNSSDAHHSVMFMCEKAVEKEIPGICITDHCELRTFEEGQYEMRITQSVFEVQKARRVFNGKLAVMAGIELSDVLYDPALTSSILERFPFDMVMVSQHNTLSGEDIYYSDFGAWSSGDKIRVDLRRYDDKIEEILRLTAQNGRAIEINTSGLYGALRDTMPPLCYVKRYRELGGEYITLGSDAHSAAALGRGIDSGMEMLLEAGFSYFTFYKERHPLQFKII